MAAALILLQACSKQAEQKPFVARVGQSALTEEDLAEAHDSLAQTPDRRREYIAEWVNAELLYQEAKRRGLTDSDRLRRQIEATTRKLVIGALLEQELYADENVSDDDVVVLYNSGADAFRLREDVANVSYALFGDRDAANGFRGKLVRNTAWTVAVEEVQKDSALKPHLLLVATRQYFTQSNLYPAELWKLAKNLAILLHGPRGPLIYFLFEHRTRQNNDILRLPARAENILNFTDYFVHCGNTNTYPHLIEDACIRNPLPLP